MKKSKESKLNLKPGFPMRAFGQTIVGLKGDGRAMTKQDLKDLGRRK